MNSKSSSNTSQENPKGKRLGFGYEKKSPESPSVQLARAAFLNAILERKSDAVTNLFSSAYGPFEEFLRSKEELLGSRYSSIESAVPTEAFILRQPKFLRARAIESVIPDWQALRQLENGEDLVRSLESWASTHNLRERWCMNHALTFLKEFECSDGKNMAFTLWRSHGDSHYLANVARSAWACAVHKSCDALGAQFQTSAELPQCGPYAFEFSYERIHFVVSGPIFKSKSDFRQEAHEKFNAAGGKNTPGAKKALTFRLRQFEDQFQGTMVSSGLEEPPLRWAADRHIKWLVEYQVPPCQTYRGIAGTDNNDKTVRDGVQGIARLIGLTLRIAKAGRPQGIAEKSARRRALHHADRM